ncbi:MAG: hypothetical protein ACLRL6_04200 [Clostridium sp.]
MQQPFVNSPALRYWMQTLLAYRLCIRMQACSKNKKRLCRFCISAAGNYAIQDQLCAAQLMGMAEVYDAWTLLQALTVWPARALDRGELGHIQRNAQADILLFAHTDIHALFHTLGAQHLSQVIKKGIRVFPNILIS